MAADSHADSRVLAGRLLLLLLSVLYLSFIASVYRPFSFLDYDPGWQASVVQSLVEDVDFDLKNQLNADPREAGDQTALGVRGEWYPLHEWLMPVVTVPFYLIFGLNGCLMVNVISMLALCFGAYALALRFSAVKAAFFSALALGVTGSCIAYSYSFSIDVFGAALAVWAVWALFEERPFAAGALFGLAVLGRTVNAPLALICLVYVALKRRKAPFDPVRFVAGAAPFAALFFWMNYAMFGSPFTVAYNRWTHFVEGSAVISAQGQRFGLPSYSTLAELLFAGQHSLLFMHPLGFVGFLLGWLCLSGRRAEKCLLYAAAVPTFAVVASYGALAYPGGIGNRYLFAVCAFGTTLLSCPLNSVFRFANTRGARPHGEAVSD